MDKTKGREGEGGDGRRQGRKRRSRTQSTWSHIPGAICCHHHHPLLPSTTWRRRKSSIIKSCQSIWTNPLGARRRRRRRNRRRSTQGTWPHKPGAFCGHDHHHLPSPPPTTWCSRNRAMLKIKHCQCIWTNPREEGGGEGGWRRGREEKKEEYTRYLTTHTLSLLWPSPQPPQPTFTNTHYIMVQKRSNNKKIVSLDRQIHWKGGGREGGG